MRVSSFEGFSEMVRGWVVLRRHSATDGHVGFGYAWRRSSLGDPHTGGEHTPESCTPGV